ncbi:MAG: hypothetical protein ACK550_13755 [Synechococcaceae cyanobacterium]|jgi:hypothetical protein
MPWVIGPRAAAAQPTPAAPCVPPQPPDRPTSLLRCLRDTRSLIISSGMPYTPVRVQGFTGFFVRAAFRAPCARPA